MRRNNSTEQWVRMLVYLILMPTVTLTEDSSLPLCYWKNMAFTEDGFQKVTCALCYTYMHISNFVPGMKARLVGEGLLLVENITVEANTTLPHRQLVQTFSSTSAFDKWTKCCIKAAECCSDMTNDNNIVNGSGWCPWTWDGWLCWPQTPPSSTAQHPCPSYIRFGTTEHNCDLTVKKFCRKDGQWQGHPANESVQWTDYSTCSIHGVMEMRIYVSVISYIISTALLLPAIIIFHAFRQLHGHRIILHKNLFISLLLNAIFHIWFKTGVLLATYDEINNEDSTLKENAPFCKLLVLLTKYFRLTNYMWMFCEGLYLHHMIAVTFPGEWHPMYFYIIGWGFPLLPVFVYILLRIFNSDEYCWAFPVEPSEWVLNVPSLLSLIVNVFFLVDIIRTLVMKLRAPHHQESTQYRKAVRATIVLVPLFGLHYAITVYRPESGTCQWPELYVYLDNLLDGLQGAIVALIFCYINGEVHTLVKRSYHNFMELRNPSFGTRQCLGCNTISTTQTNL